MLKNYFLIALRNFWRHKVFSLINVLGLAIGIAASLVIYLIIDYHFSFDKFHKDGERIYRIVTDMKFAGADFKNSGVTAPLYNAVKTEVTGVQQAAAFFTYNATVQIPSAGKGQPVVFKNEGNIVFTDKNYFDLFAHRWLAGSPGSALNEPFQVMLGETMARKYFPGVAFTDIIGRRITYNDSLQMAVSGILADWTENSDLVFNQFASFATMQATGLKNNFGLESWGSTNSASQLFVKLAPQTAPAQVYGQLKKLMKKYRPDDNKDEKNTAAWNLQPLSDLHFNGTYGNYGLPMANGPTLYSLAAAALFLLLLACINFINLTTAQAAQRAKEIGIRKTMGSSRSQLVFQFLSETFFVTLLAMLLSIALMPWILKLFSDFIPQGVRFNLIQQPQIAVFLIVLTGAVTLLSGFYPALVLSQYKPVLVLKNQAYTNTGKTRSALLRKTLTVSQFAIAQVFIMGTVLVGKQIHYSLTKDLGFKKEAILSFSLPFDFSRKVDTKRAVLQAELQTIPQISSFSIGGPPPSSNGMSSSTLTFTDGKKEVQTNVEFKYGDTNYLRLYGIRLLAGRNVAQSDSTTEYIINETYLHTLGFQKPEDAIGKSIEENKRRIPIVGVMADFHQRSLHDPIQPIAFSCEPRNSYDFHVALKLQVPGSHTWQNAIALMEKKYKRLYPKEDFNYQFFDESIAQFYKSDQDLSKLLSWATALAVIVSCLGLLGLVIYTTNQRTKEIGIRKVLGATVAQIVRLLSKDFLLLVTVAFAIAVPIAWWGMKQWLQNFAYRTTISWWVFGVSGAGMLLLALAVLSARTIKAATTNPVKNLRTE